MKTKVKIAICVCAVGFCCYGIGRAQTAPSYQADWERRLNLAGNMEGKPNAEALALYLATAAGNPDLTRSATKVGFQWEKRTEPTDTLFSALQVQQNQKIIEQNAEIIALLKAKK